MTTMIGFTLTGRPTMSDDNRPNNAGNTMTTPTTISIDGTDYVRADSIDQPVPDGPVRIVVLQRGWVVVGYYSEDGDEVIVQQAKVIRRWGTTKGLGELVDGPTADTILDPAGLVLAHRLGVVLTIVARKDKWEAHL
jgi:hypothetical protein